MAFGCRLHLIEPLGFHMDEKHLRRAGMDYRDEIEYHIYPDWNSFREKNCGDFYYVTRYGKRPPSSFAYDPEHEIYIVFGKESTGIPKEILRENLDRCMRIPMKADARSLNLSNCVAIVAYQVLDRLGFPGLSTVEVLKGEDFLTCGHASE